MPEIAIERRTVLGGGLAAVLGGCASCGDLKPVALGSGQTPIGDAHVHLFNAADLPVAGFFEHVLVPAHLSSWPELALAFVDLAMSVLKRLSATATSELGQMRAPWRDTEDVSPEAFADAVADRAEQQLQAQGAKAAAERDPLTNLADSYFFLAELIAQGGRSAGRSEALIGQVDRAALARIAGEGAQAADGGAQAFADGRSLEEIWQLIAWAFRMTHSRCGHVRQYLAAMDSPDTVTDLVVNLLVDYDCWLDDGPKAGSEQPAQVAFWTHYARAASKRVRIETFAGYDPLKHTIQMRAGEGSYFADLVGWAGAAPDATHRVAGFKLYPPMGFRVWENGPLPEPDPVNGRAAEIVRALWQGKGWELSELPGALDAALDELFKVATRDDIPLLAHGADSNEAYPGAGLNGHTHYWLKRAQSLPPAPGRSPLRACIAHYQDQFDLNGDVRKILDLNLAGGANIYFDVAFEEQIIEQPNGAEQLLARLAALCEGREAAADYFLFGTDWIMLGQLPRHQAYVSKIDQAIAKSDFWRDGRTKLMGGNLRRFLKIVPA